MLIRDMRIGEMRIGKIIADIIGYRFFKDSDTDVNRKTYFTKDYPGRIKNEGSHRKTQFVSHLYIET